MARLDPSQAMQKTSLTLSLQRQMMENLVIAKAREETLQRKMEERRLRLQEAANRRFCSQVALTPEEREQRALYAAILEYEQDHDWPKHWKAKLKRNPGDLSLVTSLVSHLLSLPDHPIAQLLRRLQCSVYSALYPAVSRAAAPAPGCCPPTPNPGSRRLRPSQSLHCMLSPPEPSAAPRPQDSPPTPPLQPGPVGSPSPLGDTASGLPDKDSSFEDLEQFLGTSERQGRGRGVQPEPQLQQLKTTVEEIHNAIADRLLSLTLLAFEGLNTAASKDRCLACIEEPFFCPLWPLLLALYRSVHRAREAALSRSMELYRNAPPTAIGIPTKLLPQNPEAKGATDYPYCAAAQELGLLVLESCPQKKLECIVRTLRIICVCAEDYCPTPEATPQAGPPPIAAAAIGADDLLPILSFVVLRSGLPQLVSECAALEEFIHEGRSWGLSPEQHLPGEGMGIQCHPWLYRPRTSTWWERPPLAQPPGQPHLPTLSTQVPDRRGGLLPHITAECPELRGAAAPGRPGQVGQLEPRVPAGPGLASQGCLFYTWSHGIY
ncbi:VPS9 domain-containing protein 1 isoform X15 [Pan troglodytes]|nr:VPS9 domain-containing protein 1 isoform X14 [Pan troglodytes]